MWSSCPVTDGFDLTMEEFVVLLLLPFFPYSFRCHEQYFIFIFLFLIAPYLMHAYNVTNCSERTQVLLTSAAYVHLKHLHFSKHTRNLPPASRAILLSGPAGILSKNLTLSCRNLFKF